MNSGPVPPTRRDLMHLSLRPIWALSLWFFVAAHAATIEGSGWKLDGGADWSLGESSGDDATGRTWQWAHKNTHAVTITEVPAAPALSLEQAAAGAFQSFSESEENASIEDQGALPSAYWIRMTGGNAMAQSGQTSWWFALPSGKKLNAFWTWTPGSADSDQLGLLSRLQIGGKLVVLNSTPSAPASATAAGVAATLSETSPPKLPAKTTADLFVEFDAAYAVAPDTAGRAKAVADYLNALDAAHAPEEKAEVLECVRRFRTAEGPHGLFNLLLKAPSAHTALIQGALDDFERRMVKSFAQSYSEKSARDQHESIARTQALTPAEKLASILHPQRAATPDARARATLPPPPYDLNVLRRRAFSGDRTAILDLSLHYGGVYDPNLAHAPSSKYWNLRGVEAGWRDVLVELGALKSDDQFTTLLATLSRQGSLVAEAFLGFAAQPPPFVASTGTLTFDTADGRRFVGTTRTLGHSYARSYLPSEYASENLDIVTVEERSRDDQGGILFVDGRPENHVPEGLFQPKPFFGPLGRRHGYKATRFRKDYPTPPMQWGDVLVLDGKIIAERPAHTEGRLTPLGFSPDEKQFAHLETGKDADRLVIDQRDYTTAPKIAPLIAWLGGKPVYAAKDAQGNTAVFVGLEKKQPVTANVRQILVSGNQLLITTYADSTGGEYVFHDGVRHGPYADVRLPGFSPSGRHAWWFAMPAKDKKADYQLFMNGQPTEGTLNILSAAAPVFDRDETHWVATGKRTEDGYTLVRDGKVIFTSKHQSLSHPSISPDGKHWGVAPQAGLRSTVVIDGELKAESRRQPDVTAGTLLNDKFTTPRVFWTPDSKPAWFVSNEKGWRLVVNGIAGSQCDFIDETSVGFFGNQPFYKAEADGKPQLVIGNYRLTLPGEPVKTVRVGDRLRLLLEQKPEGAADTEESLYSSKPKAQPSVILLLELDLAQFSASPSLKKAPDIHR